MLRKSVILIVSVMMLLPWSLAANAAENGVSISLEHISVNLHDTKAIRRGAKLYATYCMACHTMKYLRYNKLAQQEGVLYSKMPIDQKEWTYPTPPPDLTLIANVRGADWLYNYLHSFYQDSKSASGSNNLLVPNSSMPNILQGLQGTQVLVNGHVRGYSKPSFSKPHWFDRLKLESQGSMTPQQYNQATKDLVSFLVYASDPHRIQRQHIGYWVIVFLIILAALLFFLKKEYWRDIK